MQTNFGYVIDTLVALAQVSCYNIVPYGWLHILPVHSLNPRLRHLDIY